MKSMFWAVASLLENPTTILGYVTWGLIAGLLAVILFILAVHAGEGAI